VSFAELGITRLGKSTCLVCARGRRTPGARLGQVMRGGRTGGGSRKDSAGLACEEQAFRSGETAEALDQLAQSDQGPDHDTRQRHGCAIGQYGKCR